MHNKIKFRLHDIQKMLFLNNIFLELNFIFLL